MADDTFEIALAVTGEDKAARAFENLKLRELEAKQEATKLAAELRKLHASGKATAEQTEAAARAYIRAKQQAQEYAGQARRVQQAITASTRARTTDTKAITAQTAALTAQTAHVHGLGRRLGETAGAVGNLGGVLGTVSPQFGRLGSTVGAVGTAFTAATGAMGPMGFALAGITAAVGLVGSTMSTTGDEAERLNERFDQQRQRVADLDDKYEALVNRIGQARERFNALFGLGVESAAQAEDAVQNTADRIQATEQQIEGLRRSIRNLERMDPTVARDALATQRRLLALAEDRLAILEFQRDATRNLVADTAALEEAEQKRREAQREEERLRAQAASERARAREALLRLERDAGDETVRIFRESRDEMQRLELDHFDSQLEALRDYMDARRAMQAAELVWHKQDIAERAEADRQVNRAIAEGERELKAEEDEEKRRRERNAQEAARRAASEQQALIQRQKELGAITTNMWDSIGSTVTDAAGEMFRFVISGAEGGGDAFLAMLDSFLEATSVQYTIKALAEGAEAVAAAARYDYAAAAQHGVAAGLAAGVAAATGIGGAAISVPSVSTGGGAAPAQLAPVSTGGGGGTVIHTTVNLYAPQAVWTDRERAELIANGLRDAERYRPGSTG